MDRYTTLFRSLGATLRPGNDAAALTRAEELLAVRFPEDLREFYQAADGLVVPDLDLDIIPLSHIGGYNGDLKEGFGYAPFTQCNDSDRYAICCAGPLFGFVVLLFLDDWPDLVCRSLGRFLDLVADRQQQVRGTNEKQRVLRGHRVAGDLAWERPERTADDARIGGDLIRYAERFDSRGGEHWESLRFAAQMFGRGHEADMARVLALGNEDVREAVLRRCQGLGTPAAEALLQRDAQEFDRFVMELAKAVESAGLEVRRLPGCSRASATARTRAWCVEPGPIWPNLEMHYALRHDPSFLEEWLERLRRMVAEGKK